MLVDYTIEVIETKTIPDYKPNISTTYAPHIVSTEVIGKLGQENYWLDDEIVNGAQHVIRLQRPAVYGLQDTVLGSAGYFCKPDGPFVQILHTGLLHWVCVSNIHSKHTEEVVVYDSLLGTSTTDIKRQLQGRKLHFIVTS